MTTQTRQVLQSNTEFPKITHQMFTFQLIHL